MSDDPEAELPPAAPVSDDPPIAFQVPALKRLLLAVGALGLVVGAGGVGVAWALSGPGETPKPAVSASPSASAATTFSLTGTMELNQLSLASGPCAGTGGYSDISQGTSVTVYDGGGQVVATGHLSSGTRSGLKCDFPVWVGDVPVGPRFYQVEVSHRGKITLSAEDAKAGKFAASLG